MCVDRRRCAWCGRLCRYFGEDKFHNCTRCQLWYKRNRCGQIKNALGSMKGEAGETRISLLGILPIEVWRRILDLVCGSIHDVDMYVQNRIWRQVLCGPGLSEFLPSDESFSESEAKDDAYEYWMNKPMPPGVSKFWRFWMLELKEGCRALVPPNGDGGGFGLVYYRIISVVIAFLGPWRDFGVADGPSWNRGSRYRESQRKNQWGQLALVA